jgi:aspartokinase
MNKYLLSAICLAIGVAVGLVTKPAKIVTKTEIVEKVVTVKEEGKIKVVKVVETVRPDGTKTTVTDSTEESKSKEATNLEKASLNEKVVSNETGARLNVLVGSNISKAPELNYGLMLSKRLIGPISFGVFGMKGGEYGLTAGIQF